MNCFSEPERRRRGQASFSYRIFKKIVFLKDVSTIWHTHCCNMEAFLAGISRSQDKIMKLSYVVGKLSFIDTPKIYDQGSIVEGKVSERCDLVLHLFSVLYRVQLWPRAFSVMHLFAFNRLKLFTSIIHRFLTSWSICCTVTDGQHTCYRTSQLIAMVSPLSH